MGSNVDEEPNRVLHFIFLFKGISNQRRKIFDSLGFENQE